MSVSLGQLRALAAVVDAGTFTDGAIALRVSQAAVSRAIQALEREVGAPVLSRTTRQVALTPTGRVVLERARRILDEVAYLEGSVTATAPETRIGYAWSALGKQTAAFQRRWKAEHPAHPVLLVQSNTPTSGLAEGEVDLAIVRRPLSDGRRYETAEIGPERRYAAIASDDPLARRRSVTLTDFADRVVGIDLRTGTTTTELWDDRPGPAQFRDTRHVEDWLTLVAAGEVIGMTSEATVAQHPRPGVAYRLVRDAPAITLALAWRRNAPPSWRTEILALARSLITR
jgi:DNA-binding transcriptional LysR family regulator